MSVFESIIDKVIVGGYDDDGNGNPDPSMLTFIYKTGFSNNVDGNKHKPPRKNAKKDSETSGTELCSFTDNGDNKLRSFNSDNTCGDGDIDAQSLTAAVGGWREGDVPQRSKKGKQKNLATLFSGTAR